MKNIFPLGEPVENPEPAELPELKTYVGKTVTLDPLNAERDAEYLLDACSGREDKEAIWNYIPFGGPFTDVNSIRVWLKFCQEHPTYTFFAVRDNKTGRAIGMVSFLNIVPVMRTLEVGFIWYHPDYQRTNVNTESIYLMLCEAFDRKKYRRVEWKCDSLNQRSRNAAQRLGFQFEGIFRKHMINRGRNRDTAWYAMFDDTWPAIKQNMETWLYYNNDKRLSLAAMNKSILQEESL